MRRFSTISIIYALFCLIVRPAFAANTPNFPTCINPQGELIASYPEGTHGIVGSVDTYTGSDHVYKVTDTQVLQCFCSTSGAGIQTDWMKATTYTSDEVAALKVGGWTYVPNGALWGLDADPYLAINMNYSCLGQSSGGIGGAGDGLSDGRSDGLSSCPECTQALGIGGGDILGLATTGDSWRLYVVFAAALIFLAAGIFSLRKSV